MGVNRINFRDPAAQREGIGRRLAHAVLLACFIWFSGFLMFTASIPRTVADPDSRTDAIVVLTGGGDRLAEGFRLLGAGLSPRLLITGVAEGVSLEQLIEGLGEDRGMAPAGLLACCVTLGYQAGDTVGNAAETADWVSGNGVGSVRLVTANYHMRRSEMEFHRALPGIAIIPNPVFPPEVQDQWWFVKPRLLALIAGEYHKFVGACGRGLLQDALASLAGLRHWAGTAWQAISLPEWMHLGWLKPLLPGKA